jgi:hypothetical protein
MKTYNGDLDTSLKGDLPIYFNYLLLPLIFVSAFSSSSSSSLTSEGVYQWTNVEAIVLSQGIEVSRANNHI